MQFLIIGLDGIDEGAKERRLAVREQHIELGDKLLTSGNMWYGAALLHDDGTMKGSMLMMSFKSEEKLNEWFDTEPYIVGEVWKDITIHKCNTRDPWQFNRPKEWFENQQGIKSDSVLDIARLYFEFSNQKNLEAIGLLLTNTTTYSSQNVGVFLGVEQIMEMKKTFYKGFTEMNWDVKSVEETREGIVLFDFIFTGTSADGERIERPGLEYVIVKDGKIQHIEVRNK